MRLPNGLPYFGMIFLVSGFAIESGLIARQNDSPGQIEIVSKWLQLANQPKIKSRNGDSRIGISSNETSVGKALILYCLTEKYETRDRVHSKSIGPLTYQVRYEGQRRLIKELMQLSLSDLADYSTSTVLFRVAIPFPHPGKATIMVFGDDKKKSIAEIEVKKFFNDEEKLIVVDSSPDSTKGPYELTHQPGKFKIESVIEDMDTRFDDKFFFDSEGWHLTRGLIRQLDREVRSSGSRLLVVHFLDVEQIHNYPDLPLKEFEAFLEQEGIPSINLYPTFASLSPSDLRTHIFKSDSHFNAKGHRRLAESTIDFIVRQVCGSGRLT